jgi:hypothetical protein
MGTGNGAMGKLVLSLRRKADSHRNTEFYIMREQQWRV